MNRRLLVLGAVDVLVAAAAGLLVGWLFGVAGQEDTQPPVCSNRWGTTIDCEQGDAVTVAAWIVFGVLLLGLWAFHARRARTA